MIALTPRQREVLTVLATGMTQRQAAELLCCSKRTIEAHASAALEATGTRNILNACLATGVLVPGPLWKQ